MGALRCRRQAHRGQGTRSQGSSGGRSVPSGTAGSCGGLVLDSGLQAGRAGVAALWAVAPERASHQRGRLGARNPSRCVASAASAFPVLFAVPTQLLSTVEMRNVLAVGHTCWFLGVYLFSI